MQVATHKKKIREKNGFSASETNECNKNAGEKLSS